MESYIQISLLNDFVFCPKSIYFHGLYSGYADSQYKDKPQRVGTLKHETIDTGGYSTRKGVLQGMSIYSEKYNIAGKIDVFDANSGELVERKALIKKIYDGYRYQLYAQYFCLIEMGYDVRRLFFHSLDDNKRYEVKIPGEEKIKEFEDLLKKLKSFSVEAKDFRPQAEKCKNCIYSNLCNSSLA